MNFKKVKPKGTKSKFCEKLITKLSNKSSSPKSYFERKLLDHKIKEVKPKRVSSMETRHLELQEPQSKTEYFDLKRGQSPNYTSHLNLN